MRALGRSRTAVMISGRGSNLGALLRAAEDPAYPAEISLVISNDEQAGGLMLARDAGVPTAVFSNRTYGKDRPSQERDMHGCLVDRGIDLVVLAGYMRVLGGDFVRRWQGRMINIHPSLLPKYPGLHTHERALEAGDTEHGCTVHWVIAELDAGPIISQARVPVMPGDTAETLAARVLLQEHILLPQVLAKVARDTILGDERISSVALLGPSTGIHVLPPPNRHHDVIMLMKSRGFDIEEIAGSRQGFVTSVGRFVDREQALEIALLSGQVREKDRPVPGLPELFSEDLW